MVMAPIPNEREKNACPMASKKMVDFTVLRFGLNKNSNPSDAPERVSERMPNTINIRKRSGINILADCSMPRFTPERMKNAVSRVKASTHTICRVEF